jgi:hypothetical protein
MIYELVANDGEWHFRSGNPCTAITQRNDALSLLKVSRQLYQEMHHLAYTSTEIHIYNWQSFGSWLRNCTPPQLQSIKTIHFHLLVVLNRVGLWLGDRLSFAKHTPAHWQNIRRTWPMLPNIASIVIHMHPYADPRGYLNPLQAGGIWARRAAYAGDRFQEEMAYLFLVNVQVTAVWDVPRYSWRIRHTVLAMERDTIVDANGYLRCNHANTEFIFFTKRCLACASFR